MKCEDCKYYQLKVSECRKNPPSLVLHQQYQAVERIIFETKTEFPVVNKDDWCGKYNPRVR